MRWASRSFLFVACCTLPRLHEAFQQPSGPGNQIGLLLKDAKCRGPEIWDRISTKTSLQAMPGRQNQSASVVDETDISQQLVGTLVLFTVPLSWGTYVPVVRYLYAINPPVPGLVFSACYYTLAAATTTLLAIVQSRHSDPGTGEGKENQNNPTHSMIPVTGGVELGLYLFIANCLQVVALRTVESDRAAFLVQLTTVMVPLAEALFAGTVSSIPRLTWIACITALGGIFVMGLDGQDDLIIGDDPLQSLFGAAYSFSQGDWLIVGAAVLYTLHVVRLGSYARMTTPIALAASKATAEAVFSVLLVASMVGLSQHLPGDRTSFERSDRLLSFLVETGNEISSFFTSFRAGLSDGSISSSDLVPACGAVLWTGWVTCGYTIWAQSFGQSRIR
jgi:hypothetical protein